MTTIGEALALGLRHHCAGELARAEQIYRQVLEVEPGNAEALARLGALALQTAHRDEAVRLLEQAVATDPSVAEYHSNLGSAYLALGRQADAQAAFAEAIRRDGASASAHYNMGVVLDGLGRLEAAADSYRRSLALEAASAPTHNNLGELLRRAGQLDEALAHLDQAVALDPAYARAHFNRAVVLLSLGRMAEGFGEYEWRLRCPGMASPQFAEPAWDGSPLANETLLVHAEQGLGDTLQFIRYLPLVRGRCANVIAEVPSALAPILEQSGIGGLVAQGSPLPPFDRQIALLSLPHAFQTTLESIPSGVPYLSAKPELVEHWHGELAAYEGFKIGIAWQGRGSFRTDLNRSMDVSNFLPLAQIPGVRLISLQKGPGAEQISAVRERFSVVDFGSALDERSGPFMDAAAIMKNLDLVITSDTAAAHLAGALGVNTWLALGAAPDWRWLAQRADSPWYPSLRLFRQAVRGDWPAVFETMAEELSRLVRAR